MVVEEVICWEQTHHKSSRNRYLCFNCEVQKMIEKCELWIFQNNILDIRNAFVSLYACVWYFSFIIQSDQSKILWTFLLCFCPLSKIFTMIYKLTRQKAVQCLILLHDIVLVHKSWSWPVNDYKEWFILISWLIDWWMDGWIDWLID